MLSKKIVDIGLKPFSVLSHFRAGLQSSYPIINKLLNFQSNNVNNDQNSRQEEEKTDNRENDRRQNNNEDSRDRDNSYYSASTAIFPFLLYMTAKISNISCFFKSEKPEVTLHPKN
jgi:hypothetical protein